MDIDWDDEKVDEAATDPPVEWVVGGVVALVLMGVGIVATVLDLLGMAGGILAAAPTLELLFDLSILVFVIGLALFVLSMTEWEKELD